MPKNSSEAMPKNSSKATPTTSEILPTAIEATDIATQSHRWIQKKGNMDV